MAIEINVNINISQPQKIVVNLNGIFNQEAQEFYLADADGTPIASDDLQNTIK
jgi:hypothetical protein